MMKDIGLDIQESLLILSSVNRKKGTSWPLIQLPKSWHILIQLPKSNVESLTSVHGGEDVYSETLRRVEANISTEAREGHISKLRNVEDTFR